ncbi:MAG: PIN domain-containing protein [Anaerolineae bacterium]|nr:PIN domain-containing protein [Anaerolineae bacterium]
MKHPDSYDGLVDTDLFVANYLTDDPNHERAVQLFDKAEVDGLNLVTTNLVILETATVLSHRSGQTLAGKFIDITLKESAFPCIRISEALEAETIDLFRRQTKKKTSMVDCSNVVAIKRYDIQLVFAFDAFYWKDQQLKAAFQAL